MSQSNQPKAGEWWQYNGVRVYVVGLTLSGRAVCEYRDRSIAVLTAGEWWQHFEGCTGFDWKPEPEYPQYWTAYDRHLAYLRRDSDGTHVCVKFDGAESEQCDWYAIPHSGRTRLTKAEAEARIVKPEPIPEIAFDPKTFTSDWGPFEKFHSLVPEQPPKPNRIPVRLWGLRSYLHSHGMAVLCCPASVGPPTNEDWVEIKFDPQRNISDSGLYVEGPPV